MSEAELLGVIDSYITDWGRTSHERALRQELALDFYDGRTDIPVEENKSAVVSNDVADGLEWIKPSLQRVFLSAEHTAVYEPVTQEDEGAADQATDTINYVFQRECDGFRVLNDAFHDSLLHGNAIIKHRWHSEPQYKTETLTGLTEQEYMALLDDDTVEEVLEKREYLVGADGEEIKEGDEDMGSTVGVGGRAAPDTAPDQAPTAAGY
jgi:regulator of sigma D